MITRRYLVMFTILVILALIYAVLKILNMRADFAERDAARIRAEQEAAEEAEDMQEEAEIRAAAVDVDVDTEPADEEVDE